MQQQAIAKLKYVRISPQKARQVVNFVRGKNVSEALTALRYTPKKGARLIEKLVGSAIANAENNLGMDIDGLYISQIFVDSGPMLKRARFRARGRVARILKRTSHITVILKEQVSD